MATYDDDSDGLYQPRPSQEKYLAQRTLLPEWYQHPRFNATMRDLKWETPLAIQRASELMWRYGPPNSMLDKDAGGSAVWKNAGPWTRIEVKDRGDLVHHKPRPHLDLMFMTTRRQIPEEVALRLPEVSKSIVVYQIGSEVTYGCHFEGASVATDRVVGMILEGSVSIEDARDELYAELIARYAKEKKQAETAVRQSGDYRAHLENTPLMNAMLRQMIAERDKADSADAGENLALYDDVKAFLFHGNQSRSLMNAPNDEVAVAYLTNDEHMQTNSVNYRIVLQAVKNARMAMPVSSNRQQHGPLTELGDSTGQSRDAPYGYSVLETDAFNRPTILCVGCERKSKAENDCHFCDAVFCGSRCRNATGHAADRCPVQRIAVQRNTAASSASWMALLGELRRMPTSYSKGLALYVWSTVSSILLGFVHGMSWAVTDSLRVRKEAERELLYAMGQFQAPYPQLLDKRLYERELATRLDDYSNVNSTGRATIGGRAPFTVWAELVSFLSMRIKPPSEFNVPRSPFSNSGEAVRQTIDFNPFEYGTQKVRQIIQIGRTIAMTASNNVAVAGRDSRITRPDAAPWLHDGKGRRLRLDTAIGAIYNRYPGGADVDDSPISNYYYDEDEDYDNNGFYGASGKRSTGVAREHRRQGGAGDDDSEQGNDSLINETPALPTFYLGRQLPPDREIQQLFVEHVFYTYMAACSFIKNRPQASQFIERLLRNQREIGYVLEGDADGIAARALTAHVRIAAGLLTKFRELYLRKALPSIEEDMRRWQLNGQAIADYLASKFRTFDSRALRVAMADHLFLTAEYISSIAKRERDGGLEGLDKASAQFGVLGALIDAAK